MATNISGLGQTSVTQKAQSVAAAAGAPSRTVDIEADRSKQLAASDRISAAPGVRGTNPESGLSTIPSDWIQMGRSERGYAAKAGFITAESGTAQVHRTKEKISIQTPKINFSLSSDPQNPDQVTVNTPKGDFSAKIKRAGNLLTLTSPEGDRGVKIRKDGDELRFDTQGFGKADGGHLVVSTKDSPV